NLQEFFIKSESILGKLETELGWMYKTSHSNGDECRINYVVWSEIIQCPNCNYETTFTEVFFNETTKKLHRNAVCKKCGERFSKNDISVLFETKYDQILETSTKQPRRIPVIINYT